LVYSLRTPANVIRKDYLTRAGLVDAERLGRATHDIKAAYDDIAGNILLTRRVQLTSPNIYWLVFYSNNKLIGPSSPMICAKLKFEGQEYYKALTLYLNSSLQLLAYAAMARGAWVTLHGDQVWSHVRIPDVTSIPKEVLIEAMKIFNDVAKASNNVQSLYQRIALKSSLQKKIDGIALKMLGLKWSDEQLNKLYEVLDTELHIMQRILEVSQKARRRMSGSKEEEGEKSTFRYKSLIEWIEKDSSTRSMPSL
jgi:hypothetical protein